MGRFSATRIRCRSVDHVMAFRPGCCGLLGKNWTQGLDRFRCNNSSGPSAAILETFLLGLLRTDRGGYCVMGLLGEYFHIHGHNDSRSASNIFWISLFASSRLRQLLDRPRGFEKADEQLTPEQLAA